MATAKNTDDTDFDVGTVGDDADQIALYTASAGGTLLLERGLSNDPVALTSNQFYRVEADAFTLTAPVGTEGATAAMAEKAAAGMVKDGLHMELQDSSDDTAFTNRVEIAEADWTVAQ